MDSMLVQLREILDKDKEFMGEEFLSVYSRLVFGKKNDPLVIKSASYLCKEFKTFIDKVKNKQSQQYVEFISLDKLQQKMLTYISKSFTLNNKVIDGDIALEKYKAFIDNDVELSIEDKNKALSIAKQEELILDVVNEIQTSFSNKKCMFNALGQIELLKKFINNGYLECNSWNELVTKLHTILGNALLDVQSYTYDAANSLDLSTVTITDLITNNNEVTKISTGYKMFDKILQGGFQNQRIYMFGGISGGGKSLVLVNFAYRAKLFLDEKYKEDSNKHTVLYVSLENSTKETGDRFVCCALGQSIVEIENNFNNKVLTKEEYDYQIKEVFNPDNTRINITYRPAKSIDIYDIQTIITDIERSTGTKVDILFVDYADKMSAVNASKSDQEWRDLGYIVDELKSLSISLNIPIVTVTQLNRDTYKNKGKGNSSEFNMNGGNIAGSIRKRENVDFFAIFNFKSKEETDLSVQEEFSEEKIDKDFYDEHDQFKNTLDTIEPVYCIIDKNRMGQDNVKFPVYIDYPTYRMLNYPNEVVNPKVINNVDISVDKYENVSKFEERLEDTDI
jgi:hypothetical protein